MKKRIPYINISEEKLTVMNAFVEKSGVESIVYFLTDDNGLIARKIFRPDFGYSYEYANQKKIETIRTNKEKKIEEIYNIKNFENEIRPIRLLYCNDQFIGYDMTRNQDAIVLDEHSFTRNEKIDYLKKIENKLKYFHNQSIVYGDVKKSNILFSKKTGEVSFCDLDNTQVKEYPIDLYNSIIYRYKPKDMLVDKKWDAFMFNLLLLQDLNSKYYDYDDILEKLEAGYKPRYIDRYGRYILQSMVEADYTNYYNGKYLTPYVKQKKKGI